MRKEQAILAAGALLGLGGIVAGALLDHASEGVVLQQRAAETALRYHQLHAVMITALGLVLAYGDLPPASRKGLMTAALIMATGTLIFCGGLYALALTGSPYAAYGAPVGGVTLMTGWAALLLAALRHPQTR